MFISRDRTGIYIVSDKHPIRILDDYDESDFEEKALITEVMDDENMHEILKLELGETVELIPIYKVNQNAAEEVFKILDEKIGT